MDRLKGKTALITGGASGLGLATAEMFATEGAEVVIAGRRAYKGSEAAREIAGRTGRRVEFIRCDITRESEVAILAEQALAALRRIDILVNNAGIYVWKKFEETTEEEWNRVIDSNLKGIFFCCRHIVPYMIRSGKGIIINISSSVGLVGKGDVPVYSASKGGVNLLTRSLALRYGKYNIRCNSICPGTIPTDLNKEFLTQGPDPDARLRIITSQYPLGRLGSPMDVAYAAVFLASDESQWVTGVTLAVDGGYTAGRE
jgi:NAD(P)-dependent dehydrogenase (short-subunit alcohol dehydrogenase family)